LKEKPQTSNRDFIPDPRRLYYEQGRIEVLTDMLCYSYDELFFALEVVLSKSNKMYIGRCPIHDGDNKSAVSLYRDGYTVKGFWKCRTHQCHQIFKPTLIGFIRGVLSKQHGWNVNKPKEKVFDYTKTIDWCCKFLDIKLEDIKVDNEALAKKKFVAQMEVLAKQELKKASGISRKQVRQNLDIPAKFFLDKGYKKLTLDSYDVGLCTNVNREMYERVVVPIYNQDGDTMLCCTGRTIHPKCEKCHLWHNITYDCPTNEQYAVLKYSKWKNSSNSNISEHLYNLWNAAKFIHNSGTIILVEGPADVWKLEELGIHNSVALFGTELSEQQQILIETSGALNVIVILDMDEPGRKAIASIKKKIERSFTLYIPEFSVNDPGDWNEEICNNELRPLLEKIRKKF